MLIPKRTKYRKQFRGRMKGRAHRGNTVTYGEFGLVAMEHVILNVAARYGLRFSRTNR